MKFTTNSLTGKLILFFSGASISILLYIFYLSWATHQINVRSAQLENVHYPLAETIENIEVELDQNISSLRQDVLRKDTSGFRSRQLAWSDIVNPGLRSLQEKSSNLSPSSNQTIDSLNIVSLQLLESDRTITRWIGNNYMNTMTDSSFLASLSYREQSELLPFVQELSTIQSTYRKNTSR
jgi:hypothetical protein